MGSLEYGRFGYASKDEMLEKSARYWNPGKTSFWVESGVDLVIERREGYLLYDVSGKRLIDMHLNGGTYNLGHRNPEIVAALRDGLELFDVGNHHFPALARTACAERLLDVAPSGMSKVMFGSGGAHPPTPKDPADDEAGSYALLGSALDELVTHGVLAPARRPGAEFKAWVTVHGFARLCLDGAVQLQSAAMRADELESLLDFAVAGICR